MKTGLKWALRIGLSGLALYFIFRKVSWQQTWTLLRSSDIGWLVIAFIFFNASQFLSARRLLYFYKSLQVPLGYLLNLKLYYKGMFYNLFLPGGIGGDGYKVHFLYKLYRTPVKKLITATLIDRFNGLAVLGCLIVLLAGGGLLPPGLLPVSSWWLIVVYFFILFIGLLLFRKFFPVYVSAIYKATWLSFGIQVLQLVCVLCIMNALGVEGNPLAYFLLFLLSSVAAVIPFTIGGAGAREIVFLAGAPVLGILSTEAIAISLLFFLLSAVSSLIGVSINLKSVDAE